MPLIIFLQQAQFLHDTNAKELNLSFENFIKKDL